MKKIISITNSIGEEIDLNTLEFIWIGKNSAFARIKNSGFYKKYDKTNGYTIIIKED